MISFRCPGQLSDRFGVSFLGQVVEVLLNSNAQKRDVMKSIPKPAENLRTDGHKGSTTSMKPQKGESTRYAAAQQQHKIKI